MVKCFCHHACSTHGKNNKDIVPRIAKICVAHFDTKID